jgi:hypothetical protein
VDVDAILAQTKGRDGYAWIRGVGSSFREAAGLIETLRQKTNFHLIVTDSNAELLNQLRSEEKFQRERLGLLKDDGKTLDLPPYFASLIYSETLLGYDELKCLRPFGGMARVPLSQADHDALKPLLETLTEGE